MLRVLGVGEGLLPTEEGSPLEAAKIFPGMREKYCGENFPRKVKSSLSFALALLEEDSTMPLRKEEVTRYSTKAVASV